MGRHIACLNQHTVTKVTPPRATNPDLPVRCVPATTLFVPHVGQLRCASAPVKDPKMRYQNVL